MSSSGTVWSTGTSSGQFSTSPWLDLYWSDIAANGGTWDSEFEVQLTVTDNEGQSDTTSIAVKVDKNQPPTAKDAGVYEATTNTLLVVNSLTVYASDPDKEDTLKFSSTSPGIRMTRDGYFEYSPPAGVLGLQTLSYTVDDGHNPPVTKALFINIVNPRVSIYMWQDFSEVQTGNVGSGQAHIGYFEVTRTGSTDSSLTVRLGYSGNATAYIAQPDPNAPPVNNSEADYIGALPSVTFNPGQSRVFVRLESINDQRVEGQETVVGIILPDPDYYDVEFQQATIYLNDNDGWRWKKPGKFYETNSQTTQMGSDEWVSAFVGGSIDDSDYGSWSGFWQAGFKEDNYSWGGWVSDYHELMYGTASLRFTISDEGFPVLASETPATSTTGDPPTLDAVGGMTYEIVGRQVKINLKAFATVDTSGGVNSIAVNGEVNGTGFGFAVGWDNGTDTAESAKAEMPTQLLQIEQYESN